MNKSKKKARPAGSAAGQAERECHWPSGNSHNDFTTKCGTIASLLSEGRENGLHLRDLVAITGWPEREIRQQIHRERRQGVPILSDNANGYFLPADEAERAHCIRSMRHRAGEILAAAKAIEGDTEQIEGQVSMVWRMPEADENGQAENTIPEKNI